MRVSEAAMQCERYCRSPLHAAFELEGKHEGSRVAALGHLPVPSQVVQLSAPILEILHIVCRAIPLLITCTLSHPSF